MADVVVPAREGVQLRLLRDSPIRSKPHLAILAQTAFRGNARTLEKRTDAALEGETADASG